MKKKFDISLLITYIILCAVLVVVAFPIFYTISASFKTNVEIMTNQSSILPINPTFDNYITAWNSEEFNVKLLLWNSIYFTVISVIIAILSSTMGGYVFARGKFPGKKIVFGTFTGLMFINLGAITIYPLLNIIAGIHLNGTLWGLIFIGLFGMSMINVYIVRGFINTLPKGLDEAAKIDGCSFIGIFFKIIFPLLKPVVATIGILSFQGTWNSYLMPTIFTLGNPSQRTLIAGVVALKNTGEAASAWNLMLAGSVISILPVLIAFSIGNKYFVSGLANGAIKG